VDDFYSVQERRNKIKNNERARIHHLTTEDTEKPFDFKEQKLKILSYSLCTPGFKFFFVFSDNFLRSQRKNSVSSVVCFYDGGSGTTGHESTEERSPGGKIAGLPRFN
jgi:hypothetical protein